MMNYIDIIILTFIILFLGFIIYFRWIRKRPEGDCHCYRSKSCNLRVNDLKEVTLNSINGKKSD